MSDGHSRNHLDDEVQALDQRQQLLLRNEIRRFLAQKGLHRRGEGELPNGSGEDAAISVKSLAASFLAAEKAHDAMATHDDDNQRATTSGDNAAGVIAECDYADDGGGADCLVFNDTEDNFVDVFGVGGNRDNGDGEGYEGFGGGDDYDDDGSSNSSSFEADDEGGTPLTPTQETFIQSLTILKILPSSFFIPSDTTATAEGGDGAGEHLLLLLKEAVRSVIVSLLPPRALMALLTIPLQEALLLGKRSDESSHQRLQRVRKMVCMYYSQPIHINSLCARVGKAFRGLLLLSSDNKLKSASACGGDSPAFVAAPTDSSATLPSFAKAAASHVGRLLANYCDTPSTSSSRGASEPPSLLEVLLRLRAQALKGIVMMVASTTTTAMSGTIPLALCEDFVVGLGGSGGPWTRSRSSGEDAIAGSGGKRGCGIPCDVETILGFEGWEEALLPTLRCVFSSLCTLSNAGDGGDGTSTASCALLSRLTAAVGLHWLCGVDPQKVVGTTSTTFSNDDDGATSGVPAIDLSLLTARTVAWYPKWACALMAHLDDSAIILNNTAEREAEDPKSKNGGDGDGYERFSEHGDGNGADAADDHTGAAEVHAKQLIILLLDHVHALALATRRADSADDGKGQNGVDDDAIKMYERLIALTTHIVVGAALPYLSTVWLAWSMDDQWAVMRCAARTLLTDVGVFSASAPLQRHEKEEQVHVAEGSELLSLHPAFVVREAALAADPHGLWLQLWFSNPFVRWLAQSGGSLTLGRRRSEQPRIGASGGALPGVHKLPWAQRVASPTANAIRMNGTATVERWKAVVQRML